MKIQLISCLKSILCVRVSEICRVKMRRQSRAVGAVKLSVSRPSPRRLTMLVKYFGAALPRDK